MPYAARKKRQSLSNLTSRHWQEILLEGSCDLKPWRDGGIRSGLDVLKALALGAKACFVGRAWAYALGAAGESGVRDMLDILREELRVGMILSGCGDVNRASPELLLKD
jgi:L-lactate dehydrogenase (cytochrome)